MKKFMKQIIAVITALCLLACASPVYANTTSGIKFNKMPSVFKKSWSVSTDIIFSYGRITYACMPVYGYDTWWVAEDYVKKVGGVSEGMKVRGYVENSEGTRAYTKWMTSYLSGKADVVHKRSTVTYGFILDKK